MLTRIRTGEKGSVTAYTVLFAIAVIFLIDLIINGGIALNAEGQAQDLAGQAARAAADDLNVAALRSGQVALNPGYCGPASSLVATYASAMAGNGVDRVLSASVTSCQPDFRAGNGVSVTVRIRTAALVPDLPGMPKNFVESATATATPQCGVNLGGACDDG